MYLKIININKQGNMDYKGLNVDNFIPFTQVIFKQNHQEHCIIQTEEDLSEFKHDEVEVITEEDYNCIIDNLENIRIEDFRNNVSEIATELDENVKNEVGFNSAMTSMEIMMSISELEENIEELKNKLGGN